MLIGRELTHILEFYDSDPVEPEPGSLEVMAGVGAQLGRVVERHRMQAQLSEAVWLEQRHLGQELHDTVGQELASLSLIGKSLADRLREKRRTSSGPSNWPRACRRPWDRCEPGPGTVSRRGGRGGAGGGPGAHGRADLPAPPD